MRKLSNLYLAKATICPRIGARFLYYLNVYGRILLQALCDVNPTCVFIRDAVVWLFAFARAPNKVV